MHENIKHKIYNNICANTMCAHVQHNAKGNNQTLASLRKRCFVAVVNNYTEEDYIEFKEHALKHTKKAIIAKEIGEKNGTPHLQIYLEYKHPQTNERIAKIIKKGFWFQNAKGTDTENDTYCDKEGRDIWRHGFEKKTTMQEKIKKRIFEREYQDVKWKDWQANVIKYFETNDPRKILWVYDQEGNKGKTFLRKYLCLTREVLLFDGKKDNILNQLKQKCIDEDKEVKYILGDVPRAGREYMQYPLLEQLKDGHVYSGKYEGGEIWLDNPHVCIFANFEPDYRTMTEDRWEVIIL